MVRSDLPITVALPRRAARAPDAPTAGAAPDAWTIPTIFSTGDRNFARTAASATNASSRAIASTSGMIS